MLLKTTVPNYSKDPATGAILNTSQEELQAHMALRQQRREHRDLITKVDKLERIVADLESRLATLERTKCP